MLVSIASGFLVACLWPSLTLADASNAPPGVLTWCGKAYMATNDSFDPGGVLSEPVHSAEPLLFLTIRPRMSLYLASESSGEFIIDASISNLIGQPLTQRTSTQTGSNSTTLSIDITVGSDKLVSGASIPLNSTSNQVPFQLTNLRPTTDPIPVTLTATSADGTYTANTNLTFLPLRTDGGSVARIDSLYNGMQVQPYNTNSSDFVPILPYAFYIQGPFVLDNPANVSFYAEAGYNIVHVVPNGATDPTQSFGSVPTFNAFLDEVEAHGMYVMYDMRWTYMNVSAVAETVKIFGSRKSILLWYTGDEPDGTADPLNATVLAYNTIKSIDPWHPVSLVLNCYNFHYEEYSAGADIILEDVYPVGNNLSFSSQFHTLCNSTYGDCGCDFCHDQDGFTDISIRLDNLNKFDYWLGRAGTKPKWAVPQAFGDETYWVRFPTAAEEAVMTILSINHDAKAIVMWDYPTTNELGNVTSALSKVLATDPAMSFFVGAHTIMNLEYRSTSSLDNGLDVSAWVLEDKKQLLVSVVNVERNNNDATFNITLPQKVAKVNSVLWGTGEWTLGSDGNIIGKTGMTALEVDMIIFDM